LSGTKKLTEHFVVCQVNETKKKKTKKTTDPEQLSVIRKRKLKEIASSVPSQRISDMFLTPTPKGPFISFLSIKNFLLSPY
jgi:hypothetical protein